MKGLVRSLVISALLLFGAVTASPAAADPPTPAPGLPLQLALGDSWAAGFGDTVGEGGYVPDLYETLKKDFNCSVARTEEPEAGCKHLQLLNLAIPGAVTAPQPEDTPPLSPSLTEDQFPVAIPLLEARNRSDDVEVITLHTGGNDVFGPIIGACREGFNLTCAERIQTELNNYERDLSGALSTLRAAAGGDTRIIIGTYDNPFRFTVCAPLAGIPGVSTLGELVLEGAPTLGFPSGLHDIMRTVAGTPGMNVNVANVHGRLGPLDWLSTTIPTDCLHPDDSGYDEVTEVFLEVLGLDPAG